MKFTPLNNQPNISNCGFESVSPSMQLDSRGFPHISWIDKRHGHNTINYRFWDGLKWSELGKSCIDRSEEEIINSNNGIILENESPIVVFSKMDVNGSLLTVAYPSEGDWVKSELSVNYDAKWIGIVSSTEGVRFSSSSSSSSSSYVYSTSSSSSSSEMYSTSSSSSNLYSTSSSSSSLGYSTSSSSSSNLYSTSSSLSSNLYSTSSSSSSSNLYSTSSSLSSSNLYSTSSSSSSEKHSSSSSSFGHSTSSSSSSLDNGNVIVCTLDSDGELRIYKWSKSREWSYLSNYSSTIVDYYKFKMAIANDIVGFCYLKNDSIYYNFFNVDSDVWSFIDFNSVSIANESIVNFDIDSYNNEQICVLSLAWLSDGVDNFYVRHINVDSEGNQGVDESSNTIVHERAKTVKSSSYIVNGFNSICVFNDDLKRPNILAGGAETIFYCKDVVWGIEEVDIDGYCDGFVIANLNANINNESNVAVSFSSNGGIYYFDQSQDNGFEMSSPYLAVLNVKNVFLTEWECGNFTGSELSCIYSNKIGDILRESLRKVCVVVDEVYDPVCELSSSSSSEMYSTSSSSSSMGDVSSSSSSELYSTSSSSSKGYSTSSYSSSTSFGGFNEMYARYDEITDGMITPEEYFTLVPGTGIIDTYDPGINVVTNVVIPYEIGGVTVVGIRNGNNLNGVFRDKDVIVRVVAPITVANVGEYAFYLCGGIEYASFPNATSIGAYCFSQCTMLSDFRASNATSVGLSAFYESRVLSFEFNNMTNIGSGSLAFCKSLVSVNIPNATTIGASAFNRCWELISFNMPLVEAIGNNAFEECYKLASGNGLNTVEFLNATTMGDYSFLRCYDITDVNLPIMEGISTSAFAFCSSLLSVDIPLATTIGTGAFYGCTSLLTVSLPNVNGNLSQNEFIGCTSLQSVYLPEVTGIGTSSFEGCTSLVTVDIPTLYTFTGTRAFYGCTSLASVEFNNVPDIKSLTFYGCTKITTATFNNVTAIDLGAFYNCTKLDTINIPLLETISDNTFRSCTSLISVTLNGISNIGSRSFYGCSNLLSVTLGETVPTVGVEIYTGTPSTPAGLKTYVPDNAAWQLVPSPWQARPLVLDNNSSSSSSEMYSTNSSSSSSEMHSSVGG